MVAPVLMMATNPMITAPPAMAPPVSAEKVPSYPQLQP